MTDSETGTPEPGSASIAAFFAAMQEGDFDALTDLTHDDFVMEWPQSTEVFRGRENAVGAMRAQVQKPEMAGERRIVGSGDTWVVMMPLRYGDDLYHYVAVVELDGGRVKRATGYWGAPFPAEESRARYRE